ncbi:BTAD domain-containing putative transcriptional regulator [Actinomadura opuntiae]|uniref:BTAD domain-containing putative transcriptional regulator n=1 Tax=Actinomadura sp. OS1-43 TaxID=604315 RepID=UPI00255B03DC|nr:BTAD domain-containing putative transcriptional regulator [Actinomadura sp. OS1-43]MDL4819231.1 BTAD domain-containing putative transcriptional regulator [Actinomadura sp. OS1-43]
MRIGILGPLSVRDEAARPVEVSGPRLRALLVRLAAEAGRPVSAERLLDDLWDGAPPAGGGNALQALVSRLRGVAGRDLVEHGPGGYRLGIDPGEVDAVAFERAVAAARREGDPARRADGLRRALDLWRGPALADVADADYAQAAIGRLDGLRLAAVEDRVDAEAAAGRPVPPVAELEPLAAAHPLRERLRGQLMRALYAAGRQADALRVYEETRHALADQLGVDPSPELAAVHLSILRRDAAAPAAAEAPAGPPEPPELPRTNLAAQLTSFVGREEESRRIGKLLRETRLVTLTGPGGAGKTRLAGETAAGLLDGMPDGVWFVALAPVSDPGDLVQTLLTALGVPDTVRKGEARTVPRPLERLTDFLTAKRMLIVLDNCEHLVDAVAELTAHILAQAPGVRVLATSREPLGITGESLCPVPSLPLPPEDGEPEPPDALGYAAVRLFADRAAAVRPGFAVDADTVGDVVAICRALDGIPLAIELAAARLRSLTPRQVADRLGDRFRLLTAGSRAALPRHRTLRAVVDWSWDLLDGAERTVLRRLSVFAGGATPDGAVRVCGLDAPDAPHPDDVIDVIAALVDKSLVMADGDAEVRYRLLETVRVYAAERLDEAGEAGRVRSEHAAWCVDLAERAEPELRRADQLRWAARLTAERDNCTAAFRHLTTVRDVPGALRLLASLVWFWMMRDMELEAGGWARSVREIAGDTAPPGMEEEYAMCVISADLVTEMASGEGTTKESLRAALDRVIRHVPESPRHPALALAGPASSIFAGDLEDTRRRLRAVEDHPDPWVHAIVRVVLGHIALNAGEIDRAAADASEGCAEFRGLGDRWGLIIGLGGMMQVAVARGELAEAVRYGEEALGYAREGMSPEASAGMLTGLARVRAMLGDLEQARRDLDTATAAMERVGEFADAASALLLRSELALWDGDLASARDYADRAHKWVEPRRRRPDFSREVRLTYCRLGCLAEEEGDLDEAAAWHARAWDDLPNDWIMGNPLLASLLEGLAALAAARGHHVRAAELLGTAHGLLGFRHEGSHEVRRVEPAVKREIGEDGFAEAYERGRRVTRDEVFAVVPDLVDSV